MQRVVVTLTRNTVKTGLKYGNQMINANDRLHYRVKQDIAAYLRELGRQLCPDIDKPYDENNQCHVTIYVHAPTGRLQDPANWNPTVKPILDGFTDEGLWTDDNSNIVKYVTFAMGSYKTTPKKTYKLVIIIEPVEPNPKHEEVIDWNTH